MKKFLLIIMVVTMLSGLMVGCADQTQNDAETTEPNTENSSEVETDDQSTQSYKIGFPWTTTSTDPTFISVLNNVQAAVESAGGELVVVENDFTLEGLINDVDELISREVDGIVFMPLAESVLPTINQMCVEAEIPYATMFRSINDEEIKAEILASPYFAGGCYEDEETTAYNAIKEMAVLGTQNMCVINLDKGDAAGDARYRGIEKAAEEEGITILTVARGLLQQTDVTKTVESFIAAYPEMDAIFIAGTYAPGALPTLEKAISDHKLGGKVLVGRIDFDSTMGEYLENGTFHLAYGGQQQIDPLLSAVVLVNRVIGTPLADVPSFLQVNYLKLDTYEQSQDFLTFFQGEIPVFTAEEIENSLISVDEATVNQIIADFSIEDVAKRHQDLVK